MKAIITLGRVPEGFFDVAAFEFTPVDLCSEALVKIMLTRDLLNNTYHMAHPKHITMKKLSEGLSKVGHQITGIEYEKFYNYVHNNVEEEGFRREVSLIFNSLTAEGDTEERDSMHSMEVRTDFTVKALKQLDFNWPELDNEFIEKMMNYCHRVEYIT